MADPFSAVPSLSQVLGAAPPAPTSVPSSPPPDSGTGFVGSALGAGWHDLLASTAGFAQAAGKAGLDKVLPGFSDAQADAVARQRAAAAADANPAYSQGGWDPASLAYGFLRGLPSFAPMIAGSIAAPELTGAGAAAEGAGFLGRMLAPRGLAAIAGGAVGAYPGSVGENIERAQDEGQPVDQTAAQKALALGVPEALLQGAFPGSVEEIMASGPLKAAAGKGFLGRVATGAGVLGGVQATTGAATEALMQQMGDPNRTFAQRSQDILDAALSGGIQGGIFGGLTHAFGGTHDIAKTPPNNLGDNNLLTVINNVLALPPPDAPGMEKRIPDTQHFPPQPPTDIGNAPPDVAVPPAQPGQAIRALPPPDDGANPPPVIKAGDQSGTNVPPKPGEMTQEVGAPALPPPPIVAPDDSLDTMKSKMQSLSNQVLMQHALDNVGQKSGDAAISIIRDRLKDVDTSDPANVKQVLDQQDATQSNTDRVKAVTKGFVPDYIKDSLGDVQKIKESLFDEASSRDAADKPFGKRLTDLAKEFKVLGDDGKLVDPRPEAPPQDVKGPVDVNADKPITGTTNIGPEPTEPAPDQVPPKPPAAPAEPAPPVSAGRDAIPEQHQAKWDALDKIEKSLPANLPPELADTAQKIADAKSKLANPKRGEVGQVVSFTNKLRSKLDALDVIREGQPTDNSPPAEPQPPQDPAAGAKKFDVPAEGVEPQAPVAPPTATPKTGRDIFAQRFAERGGTDLANKMGASATAVRAAADFAYDRGGLGLNKLRESEGLPLDPSVKNPGEELPQPKRPLNDRPSNQDVKSDAPQSQTPTDDQPVGLTSSRPSTQSERDLAYLTASGATPRQLLQHIVRNGTSSVRRIMAARLLQLSKADPSIRMGSQAEAQRTFGPNVHVYGDYTPSMDQIRIHDMADMEHTLIHEFTHAATLRALKGGGELAQRAQKLLDFAKSQLTAGERSQYGFKNTAEMVAEALSNPNFAHFLDGLKAPADMAIPKPTVWRALKELIRRTFGFPKGAETMLDHVTDLSGRLIDQSNERFAAGSAADLNEQSGVYARSAQDFGDQVLDWVNKHPDPQSWPTKIFKMVAGWRDLGGLADAMRNTIPAMADKVKLAFTRRIYGERVAQVAVQAINMRRALPKEVQKMMSDLKQFTNLNVDPRRSWAENTWLHNLPNAAALKGEVAKANLAYNDLKRKGGAGAYDAEIQANRMLQSSYLTSELRNTLRRDHSDKVTLADDPFNRFAFDSSLRANPRAAADYWHQELENHVNLARKYIASVREAMASETDPEAKKTMGDNLKALTSIERTIAQQMTAREQAPNFALRRHGNFFVSGELHDNFTAAQVSRVQSYLQSKGFNDIAFQHNAENNSFYIRVNSQSEAENLQRAMLDLQKEKTIGAKPIASGAADKIANNPGVMPEWVQQNIQEMRDRMPNLPEGTDQNTIDQYNAARSSAVQQMVAQYLDMLPDSAVSKIFARRQGVQGFNTDMNRAFDERAMASARGVANSATAVDIGNVNQQMLKQLKTVKTDGTKSIAEKVRAQVAVNEALKREALHGFNAGASPLDAVRHMTHLFELGFSIPYAVTLASQMPTLGLPELAKTHGFASSSAAMIRAMPVAMKVMSAALKADNPTAFMLTPENLKAAGLSKEQADFIMHQDSRGDFNLSSYTSNIYDGLHHTGLAKTVHDVTGATTLYSEMAPRLVVALAAKDLFDQKATLNPKNGVNDLHSFVSDKVQRSQFQFNPDLNPRNTSKAGPLGQLGPLMTQFMGYHLKLLEKMYRESADAIGSRGEGDKAAARKFLLGHVAATAAISGTLGLPAVNLFAGLYDKLADFVTGNDTHDIKASYRNFLADTFGKGVGEALSRGLPRLGGIDLSHLGEQNIIPGTSLMSDKRQWSDAEGDFLKSMAGSAAGLGSNVVLAGRDLLNGDFLEAGQKALPEMLRNFAEGGQTLARGYRDKSGFQLPIKATTKDGLLGLLGFEPGDKAEYSEASQVKQGLEDRSQYDKQNILTHLAKSFNLGDQDAFSAWMQTSARYQASHPGEPPPAMQFGEYMREHLRSAAIAGARGTPTGVGARDLLTMGATRFGNLGNQ